MTSAPNFRGGESADPLIRPSRDPGAKGVAAHAPSVLGAHKLAGVET